MDFLLVKSWIEQPKNKSTHENSARETDRGYFDYQRIK
jgi:hypothetical protein